MNQRINLLLEGEPWKEVPLKDVKAGKLAVTKTGDILFSQKQTIYKVDIHGTVSEYAKIKGEAGSISFHSDGRLYVHDVRQNKIIAIGENGVARDLVSNVEDGFLTVSSKGIYFSEFSKDRIGFYNFSTREIHYDAVPFHPAGVAISAEQTFLNIGTSNGVFGYSFKIEEDGGLEFGQEYIHYHIPYGATGAGVSGMTIDSDNLLYSVTPMGVQVSDQLGRVNFIFSKPAEEALDVKLGGIDFDTLYLSCKGRLFSRKIKAKGILSWQSPVKPPKPGL